jgi:hypothetical protein
MDTTENKFDMDEYISQAEREHMLFELHRYLAWVGESIPEMMTIDGKDIQLHELVLKLIRKKRLTALIQDQAAGLLRAIMDLKDIAIISKLYSKLLIITLIIHFYKNIIHS